jgi:hypothetical protein
LPSAPVLILAAPGRCLQARTGFQHFCEQDRTVFGGEIM